MVFFLVRKNDEAVVTWIDCDPRVVEVVDRVSPRLVGESRWQQLVRNGSRVGTLG
jgi:hypothetical protein